MKLTGVFLIETGVVNRGDGIGNIATVKKITTPEGIKVYFSPQSYKRALWKSLQENYGWRQPLVTGESGVVQKTGTIIDSEEFDFAGTMIAEPKYQRNSVLYVDQGISINNFAGDMEFMTNMGIASMYGENEANIINRENFYGIYVLPFGIEINKIGIQEISTESLNIIIDNNNDDIRSKINKIYEALKIQEKISNIIDNLVNKIEFINQVNGKIVIKLTESERKNRLKTLLKAMGELGRQIEGSERNLTPFYAAFSLDYATPKYLLFIKDKLRKKEQISEENIKKYAEKDGKNIFVATHENYHNIVEKLINEIKFV